MAGVSCGWPWEVCNLLTQSLPKSVTAAETIRTAPTVPFIGQRLVALVEKACDRKGSDLSQQQAYVDFRMPARRKLCFKDVEYMYGHRGSSPKVRFMSTYEFALYVELAQPAAPLTVAGFADAECRA